MADDLHLQHNETLRYSCQDQSYWEGGTTDAVTVTTGESMYMNFDCSPGSYSQKALGFGSSGTLVTKGKLGLRLEATATAGSVDIDCPVNVTFTYPHYVPEIGDAVGIQSSYGIDASGVMHTYSPSAGVAVYAHAEGSFHAAAEVEAFYKTFINFDLHAGDAKNGYAFSADQKLGGFDIQALVSLVASQIPLEYPSGNPADPPIISADLNYPVINTTGTPTTDKTALSASGQDSILGVRLSLTNLITYILHKLAIPAPPLTGDYSFPKDSDDAAGSGLSSDKKSSHLFQLKLAYKILDVYLRGELGVYQKFKFLPTPTFKMQATDGMGTVLTGYLSQWKDPTTNEIHFDSPITTAVPVGTTIWYKMPASGVVHVMPSFNLESSFTNNTGMYGLGGIGIDPLSLEIEGDVAGVSLADFSWDPLNQEADLQGNIPIKDLKPKLSMSTRSLVGAPFCVARANPPMARIGTVTPQVQATTPPSSPWLRVYPFNNPDPGNAEDKGSLLVQVTSDGPSWPDVHTTPRQLYFLWDKNTSLDVQTNLSDNTVVVSLPDNLMTPGHHRLTSHVIFKDPLVDTINTIEAYSTVDFYIQYFTPHLQQMCLGSTEGDGGPIHDLDAGSADTVLAISGSGFCSDSRVVLRDIVSGEQFTVARPSHSNQGTSALTAKVPHQLLATPRVFDLYVTNPLNPQETPAKPGDTVRYSNPLRLFVRSCVPTVSLIAAAAPGVRPTAADPLPIDGPDSWITIYGSGFLPGLQVYFNNRLIDSQVLSRKQLAARVPASLLARSNFDSALAQATLAATPPAISVPVLVSNIGIVDSTGTYTGGECQALVQVFPPRQQVADVSPRSLPFAGPPTTMTITGQNLLPDSALVVAGSTTRAHFHPTATQGSFSVPAQWLQQHGRLDAYLINPYYPSTAQGTRVSLRVEAALCRGPLDVAAWPQSPTPILAADLDPRSSGPKVDKIMPWGSLLVGLNQSSGQVFCYDPTTAAWTLLGQRALDITAGPLGLYLLDGIGSRVYKYAGAPMLWTPLPQQQPVYGLLSNQSALYGLAPLNIAYSYTDASGWRSTGSPAGQLQFGVAMGELYSIGPDAKVYHYLSAPGAGRWECLSQTPTSRLIVSPSSKYLVVETADNKLSIYNPSTRSFTVFASADRAYAIGPTSLYVASPSYISQYDLASAQKSASYSVVAAGLCASDSALYVFTRP